MNHRNRLLVFLVCLNAVLLTAIVSTQVGIQPAQAQIRSNDYILIPGNYRMDQQSLWVVNLGTNQIANGVYDKSRKLVQWGPTYDLDFYFEDIAVLAENNQLRP